MEVGLLYIRLVSRSQALFQGKSHPHTYIACTMSWLYHTCNFSHLYTKVIEQSSLNLEASILSGLTSFGAHLFSADVDNNGYNGNHGNHAFSK